MMATKDTTDAPADPRPVDVRQVEDREDAFFLARIWHHYFGTEYDSERLPTPIADTLGWPDDDENAPLDSYGLVAEHADVQVGGGLAILEDHGGAVDELPEGRYDRHALAGDLNAYLCFSFVDPAWRGRGIGRRLFRERLRWAAAQDVDMVFALGWERRDGRSSRPLFESYDFVPIQQFDDYYATGEWPRTSCPDCGIWPGDDGRCRCRTTVWALDGGQIDV